MKKRIVTSLSVIIFFAGLGALAAFLLFNGIIRFNNPSLKEFPIQGIDVSNHQRKINWEKIDRKQIHFAFIKATEGGDFKDKSFIENWTNARKQGIVVGAYHFFTFCKSPEEQADNYIETVPNTSDMLPPAIDLEYSGNCKLTKSKQALLCDIETFIQKIEEHYQRRMIVYVTEDFYKDILAGKFKENYFWIRDVYTKPKTIDNIKWTFWQFTNRGRIDGIETLVDMNAFDGTKEDFENLIKVRRD